MARLPTVGGDAGNWGDVLNDYLSQSHASDGTLKADTVGAPQLRSSSVTNAAIADGTIQQTKLSTAVQAKLDAPAQLADASVTTEKLADDAVTTDKLAGFGSAGGVASLDADGRLPDNQVPLRLGESELKATNLETAVAMVAQRQRGSWVAIMGDSIAANPLAPAPSAPNGVIFYVNAKGRLWHDYLLFLSYQKVRSLGCYAVGGKTLRQVRDVQIPMMLRSGHIPDSVILAAGTNDPGASPWASTIDATHEVLLDCIFTLAARGIRPILTTIPPQPARAGYATAWNAIVRAEAARFGLPLIERNTPVRGANEDTWAAGMSDDAVHPNDLGHRTIGSAAASDTSFFAHFDLNMPPIDLTNVASGPSTDAYNLAGALWNTFTGWDVSAWSADTSNRYWQDVAFAGYPTGSVTPEAVTLSVPSGGARDATAVFTADTDVEIMALVRIDSGAFLSMYAQPRDGSGNPLGSEIPLALVLSGTGGQRFGMIHGRITAPPGTVDYRLRFNVFGNNKIAALTARRATPLG